MDSRYSLRTSALGLRITDEVVGMEQRGPIVSRRMQGSGAGTISVAFATSSLRSHYAPSDRFVVRRLTCLTLTASEERR